MKGAKRESTMMKGSGKIWICSYLPQDEGRGIEVIAGQLERALRDEGWTVETVDISCTNLPEFISRRIRPLSAWAIGRVVNRRITQGDMAICNNYFSWNVKTDNQIVIYHMTEKRRAMASRGHMGRIRNILVARLCSRVDKAAGIGRTVVAVSTSVAEEVKKYYGHEVDMIIRHVVDLNKFRPSNDKTGLRRKLGLPVNRFLVLFVGPADPKKGYDLLMDDILPRVVDSQILVLVGTGHTSREGVVALGHIPHDEIHELYQACDALVMPSFYEGIPISVVESLACGTPCVLSQTGIGKDLKDDEVLGEFVVDGGDPDTYAGHLKALQRNPELLASLSLASRKFAEEHLDLSVTMETYSKLIREVSQDCAIE